MRNLKLEVATMAFGLFSFATGAAAADLRGPIKLTPEITEVIEQTVNSPPEDCKEALSDSQGDSRLNESDIQSLVESLIEEERRPFDIRDIEYWDQRHQVSNAARLLVEEHIEAADQLISYSLSAFDQEGRPVGNFRNLDSTFEQIAKVIREMKGGKWGIIGSKVEMVFGRTAANQMLRLASAQSALKEVSEGLAKQKETLLNDRAQLIKYGRFLLMVLNELHQRVTDDRAILAEVHANIMKSYDPAAVRVQAKLLRAIAAEEEAISIYQSGLHLITTEKEMIEIEISKAEKAQSVTTAAFAMALVMKRTTKRTSDISEGLQNLDQLTTSLMEDAENAVIQQTENMYVRSRQEEKQRADLEQRAASIAGTANWASAFRSDVSSLRAAVNRLGELNFRSLVSLKRVAGN